MDIKNKVGGLVISEEVISKIATTAALEIDGVVDMVSKLATIKDVFKKQRALKPVRVKVNDNQLIIDLYISLKSGYRITDICEAVQNNVKQEIQNMTHNAVAKVNVFVEDIDLSNMAQ